MNNAQHLLQKALRNCESTELYIRVVHMKPVLGLFWTKEQVFFYIVPMGPEAGTPLAHQKMHPALQRIQWVAAGTTASSW